MEFYKQLPAGKIVNRTGDGIIYTKSPAIVDTEMAETYARELKANVFASETKSRLLTDIEDLKELPKMDVLQILAGAIKSHKHKVEKSAVFGMNTFNTIAIRLIATMAGRSDVKFFQTKDEALKYLNS